MYGILSCLWVGCDPGAQAGAEIAKIEFFRLYNAFAKLRINTFWQVKLFACDFWQPLLLVTIANLSVPRKALRIRRGVSNLDVAN